MAKLKIKSAPAAPAPTTAQAVPGRAGWTYYAIPPLLIIGVFWYCSKQAHKASAPAPAQPAVATAPAAPAAEPQAAPQEPAPAAAEQPAVQEPAAPAEADEDFTAEDKSPEEETQQEETEE